MNNKAFQVKSMTFFNWKLRLDCKKNGFKDLKGNPSFTSSLFFRLTSGLLFSLLCLNGIAYSAPSPPSKTEKAKNQLNYSMTLYGQATGSFLSKPDNKTLAINDQLFSFVYPGFAGVSGGGGLAVSVNWKALNLDLPLHE